MWPQQGAFQNWGRHCKTRRIRNPAPKRGSPGRIRNLPGKKNKSAPKLKRTPTAPRWRFLKKHQAGLRLL